jgi:Cu+-exporting ATPase
MEKSRTDLVCGMVLDEQTVRASVRLGGETYVFCSERCGNEFLTDPPRYAGVSAATSEPLQLERHEPPYTKWGPIVAPKFGAAGSGGAEYELLPEAHGNDASGEDEARASRKR